MNESINQSNRIFFIKSEIWQLGQARRHASGFLFIAKAAGMITWWRKFHWIGQRIFGIAKSSNGIECRADGRSKNMGGWVLFQAPVWSSIPAKYLIGQLSKADSHYSVLPHLQHQWPWNRVWVIHICDMNSFEKLSRCTTEGQKIS